MKCEFIQYCKQNRKAVVLVLIATLIIIGIEFVSYLSSGNRYVTNESGQVVAITRKNADEKLTLPISVEASKQGTITEEDIIVSFAKEKDTPTANKTAERVNTELASEIRDVTERLASSDKKVILLPKTVGDGVKLKWKRTRESENLLLLLLAPCVLFLLFRTEKDKWKKERERKVQSIRLRLPSLNSQLLLLLGSGLIFNDAFLRIADSYQRRTGNRDYMSQIISDIVRMADETNRSIVSSLDEEAKKLGVKEFSRLAGIITANQFKGVSLIDKLEIESELLWNQRKKTAEERGKAAETKLAFPLAVLLIVLIIVTAAPAILQI